jgi:hypothetical protein
MPKSGGPIVGCLLLVTALAGCTASRVVMDGSSYELRTPSGQMGLGGADGNLPASTPEVIQLRVGQEISLASVKEGGGANSPLHPVFRAPGSSDSGVLKVIKVYGGGGDGDYRAVGPGTALLWTSTISCDNGIDNPPPLKAFLCPVLVVHVRT